MLLSRAEAMGFLGESETVSTLSAPLIMSVLRRMGSLGLAQHAVMQAGGASLPNDAGQIINLLGQANAALENSPLPSQEWTALRAPLGDALLARLCGISGASLHRYAAAARSTPDAVAQRLHTIALIVADLRGAYNDFGVRRWFQRPRAQLGGHAPEYFLAGSWGADDPDVTRIRDLARALSGSPAT